jgi:pyruvate,water dikinase
VAVLRETSQAHLVWLNDGQPSRALVGGKAASLNRLLALGAPVPPAFALTIHAYRAFAAAHCLPVRAGDFDPAELSSLRERIVAAPFPSHLADAVSNAMQELHALAGGDHSVAVRSSGADEDSTAFSFAGLHDTILDVRTRSGLETAIKRCWASLWSDRAVAYRRTGGIAGDPSEIAVVVQHLVRSDVSFVAFTTDPVTQDDRRVVIDATWGLGEAIVSGLVVPDHITVDADGQVEEYTVGSKQLMVIPGEGPEGGARETSVPRMLRQLPALTHAQAAAIAALARDLAGTFGYPVDFEGGIAGGRIHIFQARPITTLNR